LIYYQRKNKGKTTASSTSSLTLPTNPPIASHTPSHLIPSKATPTQPIKGFPPPPPLQPPLVPKPVLPTPPAQEVPKQSEDTIEDFLLKVDLGSALNKINVPVPLLEICRLPQMKKEVIVDRLSNTGGQLHVP
jgi:hypothetical protein